ncbi:MAG TPA: DUF190 domain-containing protein [Deltaproteobacteria bacterium]|nr:DUF190 domain-containing protein [Deltaproteobacteria bacterium]
MKESGEGMLLRIFISESARYRKRPLYEQILLRAKELGIAGGTVLRGMMGYGIHGRLHTARLLRLSEDMPIIIEIADTQARLEAFLPHLDEMVEEGFITMERIRVIKYTPS